MELSEQEKGMGLMIVTCTCCGNVHKAHQASNALTYSLTPNYGCMKCQGIPLKPSQADQGVTAQRG